MIKTVVIIAIAVITTLLRFIVRFIARVVTIAKWHKKRQLKVLPDPPAGGEGGNRKTG